MSDQRPSFTVTAIGVVRRAGWPDDATTAPTDYFDPFAESLIAIYPEGVQPSRDRPVHGSRRADEPLLHRVESVEGMPEVGLFSTRSPRRPNPLGLCYPRQHGRDGNVLRVSGMDGWPGTPVLDLKGYYLRDELRPDATAPEWLTRLWAGHDAARGPHRV